IPPVQGDMPLPKVPRLVARSVPQPAVMPVPERVAAPVTAASAQLPAAVPAAGQTAAQQYTGEIVNIDVRDMDLKDFFRFIADVTGLNIVLDPAVSGSVPLPLPDVPWDQALDIVLKTHGLGSELQGNVLRIARRETLVGEEAARQAAKRAEENA